MGTVELDNEEIALLYEALSGEQSRCEESKVEKCRALRRKIGKAYTVV